MLTAWYDQQRILDSAFRIAKVDNTPYNPRNVEVRPNTQISGCIYKLGAMQNEFRRFEKWLRVDYNFEDSVITDLIESAKAELLLNGVPEYTESDEEYSLL